MYHEGSDLGPNCSLIQPVSTWRRGSNHCTWGRSTRQRFPPPVAFHPNVRTGSRVTRGALCYGAVGTRGETVQKPQVHFRIAAAFTDYSEGLMAPWLQGPMAPCHCACLYLGYRRGSFPNVVPIHTRLFLNEWFVNMTFSYNIPNIIHQTTAANIYILYTHIVDYFSIPLSKQKL